jgi:hypothetical protein
MNKIKEKINKYDKKIKLIRIKIIGIKLNINNK